MHEENPAYTLYHCTIVHTPVLGELVVAPNMLVGVTKEGQIDYLSHYGAIEQSTHGSAREYFEWHCAARSRNSDFLENSSNQQNGCHGRSRNYHGGPYEFVDFSNTPTKFLVPGFFDTHIHAAQYPNVGIGSELSLLQWLAKYTFPLENRMRAPSNGEAKELPSSKSERLRLAHQVYSKVISRNLRLGTTTASYFATIDVETTKTLADLTVQSGQRALIGKVCMDYNPNFPVYKEETEALVAGTEYLLRYCAELNASLQPKGAPKMVQGIVTPRFAPLCLRTLMKRLGDLAQSCNAHVQTHICENKDEIKLVADLFPECSDYASVYNDYGLLGPRTILAHAVHLSTSERKLILQTKSSILHCPSLNTFLTSGIAPIKRYLYDEGINVSLGTDISGGCDFQILATMKSLIMALHNKICNDDAQTGEVCEIKPSDTRAQPGSRGLQTRKEKITVADALYMATMGGAIACGMDKQLGLFEEGKWFDAQLIDVLSPDLNIDVFDFEDFRTDALVNVRLFVYKWVFCGDDRNCVKVWCNGRKVVDKAHE